MRALAPVLILAIVPLFGCSEPVRVSNLTPGPGGRFTFSAGTNTVMTENDDGAAELIRRDWLADALISSGACRSGYILDSRRFAQPQAGLFANGGDIVYAGRCL
jgi:hypothetical protein